MAMVDDLDITKRAQAATSLTLAATFHNAAPVDAHNASHAMDNVVLSAQARNVIDTWREGKSVAEAWLDHVTAPPDPTKPVVKSDNSASTNKDDKNSQSSADSQAQLKQALDTTMTDLGWLFDAMNQPKADTRLVAQAVTARMTSDNVGISPPLPEVVARAQQSGSAAALYMENLSVTIERGQVTSATVDRVALTTVHDTLRDRVAGRDRPLVLDVGGSLQQVTPEARSDEKAREINSASPDTGLRTDDPRHALLIVRQQTTLPLEDSITVKLDALFPIE
ncbi:MAG: hypothetical protein H7Z12_04015 [Rhodospirillaceae bacterium]|nr:hypothetical protein [Rhodospirillales bacterium]